MGTIFPYKPSSLSMLKMRKVEGVKKDSYSEKKPMVGSDYCRDYKRRIFEHIVKRNIG
jgi:hypothetical protein